MLIILSVNFDNLIWILTETDKTDLALKSFISFSFLFVCCSFFEVQCSAA